MGIRVNGGIRLAREQRVETGEQTMRSDIVKLTRYKRSEQLKKGLKKAKNRYTLHKRKQTFLGRRGQDMLCMKDRLNE